MITASICTIGDEILIGQIVDTNSSLISRQLGDLGIGVSHMVSLSDKSEDIISTLSKELETNDIVITTGGLGPTKDDITKDSLARMFGSKGWKKDEEQDRIMRNILSSRGIDILDINERQAIVPDCCEVIPNRFGTAPIMVFRTPEGKALYAMPGVPHETEKALQDVLTDIKQHFNLGFITHRNIMTYGLAESALSKKIEDWEDSLPEDIHLAYLPNTLTGVRLRLSLKTSLPDPSPRIEALEKELASLREILGPFVYSTEDSNLETVIGEMLRRSGKTLSSAESCTGGMIAHLITTISGSSAYFLGGVVSYAIDVKTSVLGVNPATIENFGVVSEQTAAEMAEGVRKLTSSTYSVSTTGLSELVDDERNPGGTVCIAVSGPHGTKVYRHQFKNDRKRNIERFAATALNHLRLYILEDSED